MITKFNKNNIIIMTTIMTNIDDIYFNILKSVLVNGKERKDRTNVGTISTFAQTFRVNVSTHFPLLTTKNVYWKGVVEELLWFVSGSSDSKILESKKINIWKGNTSREFLDKAGLTNYKEGELGPCFLKGTEVLTNNGYKTIENVNKEDLLYTHVGNWKPIEQVHNNNFTGNIFSIRAQYHPSNINATPEHPFYARTYEKKEIRNPTHHFEIILDEPKWINAENLNKKNTLLGFKIETIEELPVINYEFREEKLSYEIQSEDEFFMFGYFLGDGWIVKEGNYERIYFVFNDKQNDFLKEKIGKVLNLQLCKDKIDTHCMTYRCNNKKYSTILKQFGKYAHKKLIPDWIHKSPKNMIESFLEGYFQADGCYRNNNPNTKSSRRFTTVSIDIALSVQRLYLKLGKICSINFQKRGYKRIINTNNRGPREVNQRDCYFLEVYENKNKRINFFLIEKDYAWFPIREINSKYYENIETFNFTVAEDNTYTVQNLSTHNCYGYQWRKFNKVYIPLQEEKKLLKDGFVDCRDPGIDQLQEAINLINTEPTSRRILVSAWNPAQQKQMCLPACHMMYEFYVDGENMERLSILVNMRSCDVFLGLPFNIASYSLLLYMVAHVTNKKPHEVIFMLGDTHIYLNHLTQVEEQLKREKKGQPTLKIKRKVETIDDFKFEDFELENYEPHPAIKAEMAV